MVETNSRPSKENTVMDLLLKDPHLDPRVKTVVTVVKAVQEVLQPDTISIKIALKEQMSTSLCPKS